MQSRAVNEADETEDVEIISRILQGQINDFEILLNRYRGYVCKIVSGFLPADEVPDISHEVFVKVYGSLPQFDLRTSFKKWLAGIAIHRCYDYWREHYRHREIPVSALTEDHQKWVEEIVASQARDAFARTETRKEAREILQWAMAELSPEDRMVLTLVYLEGLSVTEAAKSLGWSMINVKVRAHRSRAKMRKRIEALLEGDGRT